MEQYVRHYTLKGGAAPVPLSHIVTHQSVVIGIPRSLCYKVSIWLMDGASVAGGWGTVTETVAPGSAIAGVGDFNGDRMTDLLWQDVNGALKVELLNGLAIQSSGAAGTIGADWAIA
jgi:hypothetical protein